MYILLGICGIELFVLDRHSHGRLCPSLQFHCISKGLSDRGDAVPSDWAMPCRAGLQVCESCSIGSVKLDPRMAVIDERATDHSRSLPLR